MMRFVGQIIEQVKRSLVAVALGSAVVGLAACNPQNSAESGQVGKEQAGAGATVHPVSKLKVVPLTVKSGDKTHHFKVEIAASAQEQQKGLMFRTKLGPDEGMIFPRKPADIASFWMKNTPLPLDIIFVGEDDRVLNIAANTEPYSTESVSAVGMTSLVLEIPGGRAAELGIKPGDLVEWQ